MHCEGKKKMKVTFYKLLLNRSGHQNMFDCSFKMGIP
jgi:hypothetical protein